MLDEFLLTLDRFELVAQACAQLYALLDDLPEANNSDAIVALRHTALRGLELARAAVAALDDEVVNLDALRKIISGSGLELARAAVAALDDEVVNLDALRKIISGSPQ